MGWGQEGTGGGGAGPGGPQHPGLGEPLPPPCSTCSGPSPCRWRSFKEKMSVSEECECLEPGQRPAGQRSQRSAPEGTNDQREASRWRCGAWRGRRKGWWGDPPCGVDTGKVPELATVGLCSACLFLADGGGRSEMRPPASLLPPCRAQAAFQSHSHHVYRGVSSKTKVFGAMRPIVEFQVLPSPTLIAAPSSALGTPGPSAPGLAWALTAPQPQPLRPGRWDGFRVWRARLSREAL